MGWLSYGWLEMMLKFFGNYGGTMLMDASVKSEIGARLWVFGGYLEDWGLVKNFKSYGGTM